MSRDATFCFVLACCMAVICAWASVLLALRTTELRDLRTQIEARGVAEKVEGHWEWK